MTLLAEGGDGRLAGSFSLMELARGVALRAGFVATGELRLRPRDPDRGPPMMIVYLWEA